MTCKDRVLGEVGQDECPVACQKRQGGWPGTDLVADLDRLLNVNIRFTNAIWPPAAERYTPIENVYRPENSLSHVNVERCVCPP